MDANPQRSAKHQPLMLAFTGLMLLLAATMGMAFVPLGAANVWLAMGIAGTKALVVVIVFMGLTRAIPVARLAAGAGLLWLSFAIILVMADYGTRGRDETQAPSLRAGQHVEAFDRVHFHRDE